MKRRHPRAGLASLSRGGIQRLGLTFSGGERKRPRGWKPASIPVTRAALEESVPKLKIKGWNRKILDLRPRLTTSCNEKCEFRSRLWKRGSSTLLWDLAETTWVSASLRTRN